MIQVLLLLKLCAVWLKVVGGYGDVMFVDAELKQARMVAR